MGWSFFAQSSLLVNIEMYTPVEFLDYVAGSLVQKPENIKVELIDGNEEEVIVELRVDEADLSRVIGRGGSIARSLRTLIRTFGATDKKRYILEIVE